MTATLAAAAAGRHRPRDEIRSPSGRSRGRRGGIVAARVRAGSARARRGRAASGWRGRASGGSAARLVQAGRERLAPAEAADADPRTPTPDR